MTDESYVKHDKDGDILRDEKDWQFVIQKKN